ncbi:hypothetical protein DIPPA_31434 [Diplonema papillatum]|nr:hypothetical protein DIPPA_31434 [Diplonema papillatum]
MPSESDKWPSWDCRLCQLTCGGCPVVDQCTNETMQIAGCDCVLGCPCGSNTDPAEAVFCSATEPKEWPQPPDAEHLKGEFKFFAVLSDVGFLLFAAVAFLAELNISKLAGMAPVINHWPIKCVIQLFVGVQLINNAGNVATVGDTYNHDAHHIALAGGWMLVFAGLTNVAFHAIFIRPYRAFKLCGLCCMLVVMILVPIGAALGTTADGSDSS